MPLPAHMASPRGSPAVRQLRAQHAEMLDLQCLPKKTPGWGTVAQPCGVTARRCRPWCDTDSSACGEELRLGLLSLPQESPMLGSEDPLAEVSVSQTRYSPLPRVP